jgi:phosphate transport system permease protein
MSAASKQPPQMQAGPALRRRHLAGRVFAVVCALATLTGVIMLAVLLLDVVTDSTGWIWRRVDRDPRMFALILETDPEFARRAKATDEQLFAGMQRKVQTRQRRAARRDQVLTEAELAEIRMDYWHSKYSGDEAYYERFEMQPSTPQRLSVAWAIVTDVFDNFPSRHPSKGGFKSAILGSFWLLLLTAIFAIPVGIAAAVYLEEYAAKNRLNRFIEVNIANLAGVPSIVYGILGLAVFVRGLQLGRVVLAGALTMTLLILPVIIIAAREAIKAVPDSIRQGAFALGATRWEVVRHHVLPIAMPGVLTGVILGMSRAIGETAPMIMIGALSYVAFVPQGPLDDFTVLPIQIYNWIAMPNKEFHLLAACGIFILLGILLVMNSSAIYIRHRAQRNLRW